MPHFIIEHGNALRTSQDKTRALDLAIECGANSGVMQTEDIKARLLGYADFRAADGRTSFIHITVRLLAGRSAEQKVYLAELLRDAFDHEFPTVESISIDVSNMDPDAYKKRLL